MAGPRLAVPYVLQFAGTKSCSAACTAKGLKFGLLFLTCCLSGEDPSKTFFKAVTLPEVEVNFGFNKEVLLLGKIPNTQSSFFLLFFMTFTVEKILPGVLLLNLTGIILEVLRVSLFSSTVQGGNFSFSLL